MKLAVTLMVRDEADVIRPWLDHHLAQGVDVFVITDNGSVDGTREALEAFAASGVAEVDLRHDPVHRKQQSETVTRMAREAHTLHGADWVVNADADEFLFAKDRSLTLHEVFERLDPAVNAFVVPVVNMVGPLARHGAGLSRLLWRDERSASELHAAGLISQPSGNAIHVGHPDVAVVQGNHLVTIPAGEAPAEDLALEVLHFPWRSWGQYEHRVEIAGRAYEANPDLNPSPNHHGMRDYRRLQEGVLLHYYALRHVTEAEAEAGPFTRDDSLVRSFADRGTPLADGEDEVVPEDEFVDLRRVGAALAARDAEVDRRETELGRVRENVRLLESTVQHQQLRIDAVEQLANHREAELQRMRARRVVRMADRAGDVARSVRSRIRAH
ncbi:glycosyltransferase family 2 protein [Curtobacterium sp. MCBD17_013]|uniref:glycosyltransferase family 2 protein n=1 Tax=Curtobacterium sp. MCBD17_013 TaxID=2175668 RepID=UPI000DA9A680|nr:glycosyltransferase family 2 protein [Curtobacterium sp. MCBD17_013]PZF64444.1 glycosyltransferase family 2 protein [Curtobacterium sp. MCBD17_013]